VSIWHVPIIRQLKQSSLFSNVQLSGGKVRAQLTDTRFLDIHFDPTTKSYSYALIDLALPYPGDKRLFGWDDYPHPDHPDLVGLSSYPHHFQERLPDGQWRFSESKFHGDVEKEISEVTKTIQKRIK
jgi:hypothetical protein